VLLILYPAHYFCLISPLFQVIYGDDEDGSIMQSGHLARKQELRELKILQKLEQKQFQVCGD